MHYVPAWMNTRLVNHFRNSDIFKLTSFSMFGGFVVINTPCVNHKN